MYSNYFEIMLSSEDPYFNNNVSYYVNWYQVWPLPYGEQSSYCKRNAAANIHMLKVIILKSVHV